MQSTGCSVSVLCDLIAKEIYLMMVVKSLHC